MKETLKKQMPFCSGEKDKLTLGAQLKIDKFRTYE
jgi:hypothetical protein